MLKPDGSAGGATPNARLGREGEALTSIDNDHVVRCYDVGLEQGRVWILLELVRGPDLQQLVRDAGGALPVERAVSILRQVCEGVAAAHAQGIVHRDLKPENILVADDDLAKVADFGSARLEGWGVKTTTQQNERSALYLAPERWRDSAATEEGSDVYSLGVMLYEILTGENPIAPRPAPMIEVCRRQLGHEPPPLATLGRGFPGDLSHVVQQAMSKDPARRPSARVMADALATVLWRLRAPRRAAARSVPLPGKEDGLARTEPALPAFETGEPSGSTGRGGTIPMAAFGEVGAAGGSGRAGSGDAVPGSGAAGSGAAGSGASRPDATREALPPAAPSGLPTTLRSPSRPGPAKGSVVMTEGAERASAGVPVERSVTRASRGSRGAAPAIGLVAGGVVVLAALAAGWMLAGRGGGGAGPAEAPVVATAGATTSSPAASGSASAPAAPVTATTADAGAPYPKASASAARPRAPTPRSRLPFR